MGSETEYKGLITISPPLNLVEYNYLTKFNATRHVNRKSGPYFVVAMQPFCLVARDDVLDNNIPAIGQPSVWCGWVPNGDGSNLIWDGDGSAFAQEWLEYFISHFFSKKSIAKEFCQNNFSFLEEHNLNGEIKIITSGKSENFLLKIKDNNIIATPA